MTLDATIRAVQAKLDVAVDGNPGPQTWKAIHRALVGEPPVSSGTGTLADERSERNIATLVPQVQPLARALIESAAAIGIAIKLFAPRFLDGLSTALYLVQGWAVIAAWEPLMSALPGVALVTAWHRASISTARFVQTAHWPRRPPEKCRARPSTRAGKGVSKSATIASSFPV